MTKQTKLHVAAFSLMLATLYLFYSVKLLSAFVPGLLTFVLLTAIHDHLPIKNKKLLPFIVGAIVLVLLIAVGSMSYEISQIHADTQNLLGQALTVLHEFKKYLPAPVLSHIPDEIWEKQGLQEQFTKMVSEYVSPHNVLTATSLTLKGVAHVVIGILIGMLIWFSTQYSKAYTRPKNSEELLTYAILDQICSIKRSFVQVVSAQLKISLVNTSLTGIFLLVVLPLFGVGLPYAKTLVLLTFVCGLMPVIGNLISNTLIFLLSLVVSFKVAIAAIVFLIVVHKLEYYINAKIVGQKINTSIWELLTAMFLLETLFGIWGVVLAPVIYSYIKNELRKLNLA